MHKNDLVAAVAHLADITNEQSHEVVSTIFEEITNALSRNESVNLVGFGSFTPRQRAARTGRSPKTGEPIQIAASKSIGFKPGKALKDALNA